LGSFVSSKGSSILFKIIKKVKKSVEFDKFIKIRDSKLVRDASIPS